MGALITGLISGGSSGGGGGSLTVQKNGVDVQTDVSTINFNSDEYLVTAPGAGIAQIAPRARSYSNPSRSLDTPFQIDTDRDALATYMVRVFGTVDDVTSSSIGSVEVRLSEDGVLYTGVATVGNILLGTLTAGLSITTAPITSVTVFVPAGYWVNLVGIGVGPTLFKSLEILL